MKSQCPAHARDRSRNLHKILNVNPECHTYLGRPRRICEDECLTKIQVARCDDVNNK